MEYFFGYILLCIITGSLSSIIAKEKKYSSGSWFLAGLFFGIFGLIAAAGLPINKSSLTNHKKCPFCAEIIKNEAKICRYCGKDLLSEDELLPKVIKCPKCNEELELDEIERINKKLKCPACNEEINENNLS